MSGGPSGASYQVSSPKPSGRVEPARKNVIWIVMDTARRDQISIYGEEGTLTPNIDAFAKDALVMEKAISSAPWTIPSHASMFTGMFPSKHAAHRGVPGGRFTNPLASEHVTIAEILQSYGYDTAAVAGNVAGLSRSFGFSQGFNYYFDGRPIAFSLFWGRALMAVPKGMRARLLKANEICLSSELNGLVFDWLEGQSAERPFFLFMNYMEPHDGIEHIPEPYNSMYDYDQSEFDRLFDGFDQAKVVRFEKEVSTEQMQIIEKVVARRVNLMDDNIGGLLQSLKDKGLYDDSYIVITSDHGELNGEHYSFGHNTDLYNELIWVPMIVKYPGSAKKGWSQATVQNIDIMPELLSNLKIDIPEGVQGQPFEEVSHEIVAELFEQKKAQALLYPERYYRDLRAIFTNVDGDTLKYIWSSNGDDEIFNLKKDPKELENLANEKSELAARLDKHLTAWLKSFDPVKFGNGQTHYTKEVEDRLRSLGYIK
jgi:arylsulfatase A-like enzyme